MALFLILITLLISLVPVLSAIGIIDHIDHIESGGIYFVLTHILGARIGATVGILYCFGQVSNGRLISLRSMSLITLSISLFNHEFTILIFTSIDNYTMYFPPFLYISQSFFILGCQYFSLLIRVWRIFGWDNWLG